MSVFSGSRFADTETYLDEDNGIVYLDVNREPRFLPSSDDLIIVATEGMRLDIIAKQMYGDAQLEWVLMDANPQYYTPFDVKPGDRINVPPPGRVLADA